MSAPNTLPDTLTFCISTGSEHDRRTIAEKLIIDVLKNCDVAETRESYSLQLLPNIAVFKLEKLK